MPRPRSAVSRQANDERAGRRVEGGVVLTIPWHNTHNILLIYLVRASEYLVFYMIQNGRVRSVYTSNVDERQISVS